MTSFQNPLQAYKKARVVGAQPVDLLIMTYDAAIRGCNRADHVFVIEALSLLKESLDFSIDETVAAGFFRLYAYCGDLVHNGKFAEAAEILTELRDAWSHIKPKTAESDTD